VAASVGGALYGIGRPATIVGIAAAVAFAALARALWRARDRFTPRAELARG